MSKVEEISSKQLTPTQNAQNTQNEQNESTKAGNAYEYVMNKYDNGINGELGTGDGFVPIAPDGYNRQYSMDTCDDHEVVDDVFDKEFDFTLSIVLHVCTGSNPSLLAYMLSSLLIDGLLDNNERNKDAVDKYVSELIKTQYRNTIWSVEEGVETLLKYNDKCKRIDLINFPFEILIMMDTYPIPVTVENDKTKEIFKLLNEFTAIMKKIGKDNFKGSKIIASKTNVRLPLLRNVAINNSKCNWVVFRDDDDLSCSVNEIERCFNISKERHKYIYAFNCYSGNTEKSIDGLDNTEFVEGKSSSNGMWRMIINRKFVTDNNIFNQPSIMFGEDAKYSQICYIFFNKYIKCIPQNITWFYLYVAITRRNNNDANLYSRFEEFRYYQYYKSLTKDFSFKRNENPIEFLWNHSKEQLEMFKNNILYSYLLNYSHYYEKETGHKIEIPIKDVVENVIGINIFNVNDDFNKNDFGTICGRYLGLEFGIRDAMDDKNNDCVGKAEHKSINVINISYGDNPRYYHYDQVLLFDEYDYYDIGPFNGFDRKHKFVLPSFITIRGDRKITIEQVKSIGVDNWNRYLDTCNLNDYK